MSLKKGMPKLVSCLMRRLVIIMLFINYQSSQLINISNIVAGKILFLEPTLAGTMYQLQLTDQEVVHNYGLVHFSRANLY